MPNQSMLGVGVSAEDPLFKSVSFCPNCAIALPFSDFRATGKGRPLGQDARGGTEMLSFGAVRGLGSPLEQS